MSFPFPDSRLGKYAETSQTRYGGGVETHKTIGIHVNDDVNRFEAAGNQGGSPAGDGAADRANIRTAPRSGRRRWGFRLAAISLSLVPIIALEIVLRLTVDPPPGQSPWVELHQLQPLFEMDESTQRWRIPPSRSNFFRPASFPAEKPPEVRRVFVLGGSTVQGRPWSTESAFSTWLRLRLRAADPGHEYEVINCGGVSYASYRIDKILDEVLTHRPDAVVIYTGHNEFLEDRTYAEVRDMTILDRVASSVADNVRLVGWASHWIHGDRKPSATPMKEEVDAALDHTESLRDYERDPQWRDAVERHFDATFRQMLTKCKHADVATIVCEPACDLVDTPPFKSIPSVDPTIDTPVKLRRFLRRSRHSADAHYRLGRLHYEHGESASAKQHLASARDEDVCPLRATTPIIRSIRSACRERNTALVPTIDLLDNHDSSGNMIPDGIPDPGWFVDHVHPSIAGHQRIAEAIAAELFAIGWGNPDDDALVRYQTEVTAHLSTLGEDYFTRGKQRLEGLRRWASGRAAAIGMEP